MWIKALLKKRRLSALQSFPAYRKLKKMVEARFTHNLRQVANAEKFLFLQVTQADKNETLDISGLRHPHTVYLTQGGLLSLLLCSPSHFLSSPAASYLARVHSPCRVWFSLSLSQRQFKGVCMRLVPIRSSSLFSRHWQPAIWDPLGLITPPLDSLTMHPPLLLLSSALLSSIVCYSSVAT